MKTSILIKILILFCISLSNLNAQNDVPRIISYQGVLVGADGKPINSNELEVIISFYDAQSGGAPLTASPYTVNVIGGLFSTLVNIPSSLDLNRPLWMGIKAPNLPEFPRIQLASSLYALNIADSVVSSRKIKNSSITSSHLQDQIIETKHIKDNSITANKLADGSIVNSINNLSKNVSLVGGNGVEVVPATNTRLLISLPQGGDSKEILQWNGTDQKWAPSMLYFGTEFFGDGTSNNPFKLLQGNAEGQVLKWNVNSQNWYAGIDETSSGSTSGLTSVSVTSPLSGNGTPSFPLRLSSGFKDKQILQWNETNNSWNIQDLSFDPSTIASIGRLEILNSSKENYFKALHICEAIGDKIGIARVLGNIGVVYVYISDYPIALDNYEKALNILEEIGNKDGIAANLSNIAMVYKQLTEFPKALEYLSKALHINEEIGRKHGIASNLVNIGLVYQSLLDYPKALEYHSKALHIFEEIGNKISIARIHGNLGLVYVNLSDYPKALEYYSKALHIHEEIGNKDEIARNYGNIGAVYATNESTFYHAIKAEEYLQKALLLSEEIGAKITVKNIYEHLHTLRRNETQFEEALEYYIKSVEIDKEIQSEEAKNKAVLFDQKRIIEEDEKARQLKLARFKEQERIFHNILPISIADRLIEGEQTIAESFENVSIFFSDIVGFTHLSSVVSPSELVQGLNTIFTAFDRIGTKYGLEKIKTIGDAYMAVCGVPEEFEDHQYRATQFAIEASEILQTLELGESFKGLQIRIGLHCGSVVAGIIGEKKFAYDVWGDAVNIASRMESNSEAGRINVSETFAASIQAHPEFNLIPRGELNIKGKGMMNTFWLEKAE